MSSSAPVFGGVGRVVRFGATPTPGTTSAWWTLGQLLRRVARSNAPVAEPPAGRLPAGEW